MTFAAQLDQFNDFQDVELLKQPCRCSSAAKGIIDSREHSEVELSPSTPLSSASQADSARPKAITQHQVSNERSDYLIRGFAKVPDLMSESRTKFRRR